MIAKRRTEKCLEESLHSQRGVEVYLLREDNMIGEKGKYSLLAGISVIKAHQKRFTTKHSAYGARDVLVPDRWCTIFTDHRDDPRSM